MVSIGFPLTIQTADRQPIAEVAEVTVATGLATPRRVLQILLGAVWLLDAALQFQPYMFTKAFATEVLGSSAAGNPSVIAGPITWSSNLLAGHIVLFNIGFALIQLALALGIFWPPTVRLALGASIVWSVAVWWLGEGLGGVLTGGTSVYMGAPGAVVLYAFIALLVWPRRTTGVVHAPPAASESVAVEGALGSVLPRLLWLSLWGSFVYFIVQPGDRAPNALRAMVAGMGGGEPSWIARMDDGLVAVLSNHGTEVSFVAGALCVAAGLGVFFSRTMNVAVVVAGVFGLAIWLIQDFGGIFTGEGTDPNTGLLLVLLATTFWPFRRSITAGAGGERSDDAFG